MLSFSAFPGLILIYSCRQAHVHSFVGTLPHCRKERRRTRGAGRAFTWYLRGVAEHASDALLLKPASTRRRGVLSGRGAPFSSAALALFSVPPGARRVRISFAWACSLRAACSHSSLSIFANCAPRCVPRVATKRSTLGERTLACCRLGDIRDCCGGDHSGRSNSFFSFSRFMGGRAPDGDAGAAGRTVALALRDASMQRGIARRLRSAACLSVPALWTRYASRSAAVLRLVDSGMANVSDACSVAVTWKRR